MIFFILKNIYFERYINIKLDSLSDQGMVTEYNNLDMREHALLDNHECTQAINL